MDTKNSLNLEFVDFPLARLISKLSQYLTIGKNRGAESACSLRDYQERQMVSYSELIVTYQNDFEIIISASNEEELSP
ncbi:hypothetical protein CMK13_15425 [Candidatus Poribacteria bacterium]|nr:hypothetical protein [Candidatus Poribacteria bacterium]OUT57137.1 MAG: hypothetical protein CBB75_14790 [bacterium TMED15]